MSERVVVPDLGRLAAGLLRTFKVEGYRPRLGLVHWLYLTIFVGHVVGGFGHLSATSQQYCE